MKILALDTSERQFSVAALIGDSVIAELVDHEHALTEFPSDRAVASKGVAVDLFPRINLLLGQVGWKVSEIELLAVARGPGSFTGLRTGIVAAKTIAFAREIAVQGSNTLEAMATQLGWAREKEPIQDKSRAITVHCVINAQRQQLFVGTYQIAADSNGVYSILEQSASQIMNREAWIASLSEGDWVTGTGLKPMLGMLQRLAVNIAPAAIWPSRASSSGRIAYRNYVAGHRDDLWKLEPIYFRPSYAEEG